MAPSRYRPLHAVTLACKTIIIPPRHTPRQRRSRVVLYYPEAGGICLNSYPRSLRELEQHVADFVKRHNEERPYETLDYLAPDEFERQSLTGATSADKNLQNQKLE